MHFIYIVSVHLAAIRLLAYTRCKPALEWCPIQRESITPVCVALHKPETGTSLIWLREQFKWQEWFKGESMTVLCRYGACSPTNLYFMISITSSASSLVATSRSSSLARDSVSRIRDSSCRVVIGVLSIPWCCLRRVM